MARPFISIVIPAFDEEARIITTLETVIGYLSVQEFTWEVVVVDDGSSDATPTLVSDWARGNDRVRLETIPHGGKGWAVKQGMLATAGKYRFMCDADVAMPIEQLSDFLSRMDEGYDIVIGSRQTAGARRLGEPVVRHLMGRIFNWSVRRLAVGDFQDTQCGFKCFRGEVADELFAAQRTKGFGFDVEILYLARARGCRVLEMPITWYYQKASKVRAGVDSFLMMRDTIMVRWRGMRGVYHLPPPMEKGEGVPILVNREGTESAQEGHGLVAVVVPTYNEADNLPELVDRVFALNIPNTHLIVVDDNSPDGTADVARELASRFDGKVELIQRQRRKGLGTAYVEGFSRALALGPDYVVQMDADLSHAPEYIPVVLDATRHADVVVGSRYVRGGGVDASWSLKRRLMSYLANSGIRLVAGLKVRDPTSGFKAFRGGALAELGLGRFRCKGFGFQVEVASACQELGYKVVEYPIVFRERAHGQSKMSMSIALEAIWRLLLLRWRRYEQVTDEME